MGDTAKAPFLPTATLTGSEVLPLNQAGSERKATALQIANTGVGPFSSAAVGTTFALSGAYVAFLPFVTGINSAISNNRLNGYWWSPGRPRTITTVGVRVSSASAGAVGRICVYLTGADGYPTSLFAATPEISLASGGLATSAFSSGNVAFSARVNYFVALLTGGANANLTTASSAGPALFVDTTDPAVQGARIGLGVSQTYGTPPATFPAGAAVTFFNSAPVMFYTE